MTKVPNIVPKCKFECNRSYIGIRAAGFFLSVALQIDLLLNARTWLHDDLAKS